MPEAYTVTCRCGYVWIKTSDRGMAARQWHKLYLRCVKCPRCARFASNHLIEEKVTPHPSPKVDTQDQH